jgi:hypothetical protein
MPSTFVRLGSMRFVLAFMMVACSAQPTKAPVAPSSQPAAPASPGSQSTDVQCSAKPAVFPTFDRTCSSKADCTFAVHQVDCCGSAIAIGIATRVKADFDAAERTCRSQYKLCACAAQETTEDAKQVSPGREVAVDCVAGSCRSAAP